ncbi:MAG TPA: SDR family NAD(P)-dependent oxidoreductase [Steroidobacteraceae bacterium]|nr:SDR family NAD(P)-dependent oxidoreductase [Steroidobacteraceae bacterium]
MSLAGKNAIVTGAASGIGLATATRLAREGAAVALFDINEAGAQRAADDIRAAGGRAIAARVDVSSRGQVAAGVQRAHAELGAVTILVNNAGMTGFVPFLELTEEAWDRMLAVNLKSMFLVTQAVLPDMLAAGWGRIINISSSSAQTGAQRMAHYASSKGGVVAFTKSLAQEFAAQGITANNVPPGFIDTPMLRASDALMPAGGIDKTAAASPMKRPGRPEDIAAACAFLASEDAGYITGHTLSVNGGRYSS